MMNDTSECLEKKHGDSPGLYKDQGHELKSVRSEEGKNFEVSGEAVMLDQVGSCVLGVILCFRPFLYCS